MPRVALGLNSACKTGTVELMAPMPMPETIRATIICARVYEVDWSRAPTTMTTAPAAIDFRRPICSPTMEVATDPRKHPTAKGQRAPVRDDDEGRKKRNKEAGKEKQNGDDWVRRAG
jgi:hypothetical protein